MIVNGSFSNVPMHNSKIPRLKRKMNWASIPNNDGIPIQEFKLCGDSSLKTTAFKPIPDLAPIVIEKTDLLWTCGKLLKPKFPNWSGYMTFICKDDPKSVSMISSFQLLILVLLTLMRCTLF